MRRELLLIILFGIAAIFLISGVVLLISHEDGKDNSSTQNGIFEENVKLTKDVVFSKIETSDLKVNKKPQFKVGENFEYNGYITRPSGTLKLHDTFYVEKIKRINGTDNYEIIYINDQIFETNTTITTKCAAYINRENGAITQYILQLPEENIILGDYPIFNKFYLYQPWMLALKDDLNWNIDVTIEDTKEKYSYNVVGRENFNDRECFKVERIHKTGEEIDERVVMWVDAEKRMLTKMQYWIENLKIMEIEEV